MSGQEIDLAALAKPMQDKGRPHRTGTGARNLPRREPARGTHHTEAGRAETSTRTRPTTSPETQDRTDVSEVGRPPPESHVARRLVRSRRAARPNGRHRGIVLGHRETEPSEKLLDRENLSRPSLGRALLVTDLNDFQASTGASEASGQESGQASWWRDPQPPIPETTGARSNRHQNRRMVRRPETAR